MTFGIEAGEQRLNRTADLLRRPALTRGDHYKCHLATAERPLSFPRSVRRGFFPQSMRTRPRRRVFCEARQMALVGSCAIDGHKALNRRRRFTEMLSTTKHIVINS